MKRRLFRGAVVCLVLLVPASLAGAATYSSPSYQVDASVVGSSFGGTPTSTNYSLVAAGGESIVGGGAGGSYKLTAGYASQQQNSIELAVQPSGLVAYYPLDEPSGANAYDHGLGGYTATAQTTPSWVSGKLGGALGYITGTQYPQTTETAAFNTSYVTACAWVYKTATSTNPGIVSHTNDNLSSEGMWHLGYNNGQKPRFVIRLNSADNLIVSGSVISLNAWHHICGTYDGSYSRLYVDAVEEASMVLTGALPSVTQPLTIGARSGGGQPADTQYIDHVKVFNRALSPDEIKAEYEAQNAGNQSGLTLGTVVAGTSQSVLYDAIIQTDAGGYTLSMQQNQDLTSGPNTIPPVSGSIASPSTWAESTTKGLGFTLVSTNATAIDPKWGGGTAYAALPSSSTNFYTRSGTQSSKDIVTMRLRLDVSAAQPSGAYSNVMIITGTTIP